MLRALSDYSAETGVLFQIHTNEHHVEVHWSVCTHGMRPLEFFAEHGAVGPHTLHHHCTLVTDREIEILRETGSAVSYNPLASAWKGDRVAPALAFAARGVRFGIGTDSTRSDALRLLESAETAQRLSQGMQNADFSCGAAWTWIDAATRGSADAAGLAGVTGELKPGWRADFLVLDRRQPEVIPSWDFEWELVRLYNRDQIEAVIIDGKTVMEHSQPVGWDSTAFLEANRKRAHNAVSSAPIVRCHGRSTEFRNK
jgi:cytosine/adenosine deaminase-related metal-dependent hydrolase